MLCARRKNLVLDASTNALRLPVAQRTTPFAAGKVWHRRCANRYLQKLHTGRIHKFWLERVRKFGIWAQRRWSTETIFIPLDRGSFVVVHPCSTFSECCQMATPLNAELQKTAKNGKNWGFSPTQDDRINQWRRNFAGRRVLWWVCYSSPNLALIGERGSVQEPPKCQNCPKLCFFGHRKLTQWAHSDEIWPVSVDFGSALAHQIWTSSVKGGRYRSPPKVKMCPKLWV